MASTKERIQARLKSLGKRIRTGAFNFWCFISSRQFLLNFGMLIVLVFLLLTLLFWWLKIYTRHNESVTVPDMKELTMKEAKSMLRNNHLKFKIIDSLYMEKSEPGVILSQTPEADAKVKEGRTIYLTVSAENAPMVTLPASFVSSDNGIEMVSKNLRAKGFKIKEEVPVRGNPILGGIVFKISTEGETLLEYKKKTEDLQLEKGTELTIYYYKGAGEETSIPRLLCRSLLDAKSIASEFGVTLGAIVPDNTIAVPVDSLVETDLVYIVDQSPRPDPEESMRKGEPVDIWISKVRPNNCDPDADDFLPPINVQPEDDEFREFSPEGRETNNRENVSPGDD